MSKKILSLIMVFALLAGILLVPGIVPEAKADGGLNLSYGSESSPYFTSTDSGKTQHWNYSITDDISSYQNVVVDMVVNLNPEDRLQIAIGDITNKSNRPTIIYYSDYMTYYSSYKSDARFNHVPEQVMVKIRNSQDVRISFAFDRTAHTWKLWYDGSMVAKGSYASDCSFGYLRFDFLKAGSSIKTLKLYEGARPTSESTDSPLTYYDLDFEDATDINKVTTIFDSANTHGIEEGTDGNHFLKGASNGGNAKFLIDYNTPFNANEHVVYEMEIASTCIGSTQFKFVGTGTTITGFKTDSDGRIMNDSGAVTYAKIPADGSFIKVAVAINTVQGKFSVWINGKLVAEELATNLTWVQYMQVEMSSGAGQNIMIDNLKIFDGTQPEYIYVEEPEIWPVVIDKEYLDWDFENGSHGFASTGGGASTTTLEVRNANNNQFVYLERGTAGQAQAYKSVSSVVDSDYLLIAFELATTSLKNSVFFRMQPLNGSSFYAFSFGEAGQIASQNIDTGITMLGDGTFKKFVVLMDANAHKYSVYIDGVLAVQDYSYTGDRLSYFQFDQSGVDGNLMIDNVFVASYTPVKFSAAAPVLENNLAINFKADATLFAEDCYSDPYATFKFKDETITVTDYEVVDGKYVFKFNNIAPHQMGDEITYTISATYNGEVVSSPEKTYSILKYCQSTLADANAADKVKTLVTDLLNYGAAAQTYRKYNTDALVNTGIDQALATAERNYGSVLSKGTEITDPTVDWTGSTLILESAITVRLKFTATSIEGLTVKINGQTVEPVSAGNNQWYVFYNGLNAGQLSTTIIAQIFNGETAVSNTLTYSVESYANYQITNSTDANLVDLVKAMMIYGDSAANYR